MYNCCAKKLRGGDSEILSVMDFFNNDIIGRVGCTVVAGEVWKYAAGIYGYCAGTVRSRICK